MSDEEKLSPGGSRRPVREPTREELARAGRALIEVMDLAEQLPVEHGSKLEFPRLEPRKRQP